MKATGFIYAINFGDAVKIGMSCQPEKRIKTISAMNGCFNPEFYISVEVENPRSIERKIHKIIELKKIFSETFSINMAEAIELINNQCKKVTKGRKLELKEAQENDERKRHENFKQIIAPTCRNEFSGEFFYDERFLNEVTIGCNIWLDNFGTRDDAIEMMKNLNDPIALLMLTGSIKARAIGALISALGGNDEELMKLGFIK